LGGLIDYHPLKTADLTVKKTVYQRNGVKGYIVWQTFENKLDWFHFQAGGYESLESDEQRVIKSHALFLPCAKVAASNPLPNHGGDLLLQLIGTLHLGTY
jgi:hypothetical protein